MLYAHKIQTANPLLGLSDTADWLGLGCVRQDDHLSPSIGPAVRLAVRLAGRSSQQLPQCATGDQGFNIRRTAH